MHSDKEGLDLPESTRLGVLIVLFILFAVGFVGNILTLLALPYVRKKYGPKFSVLQSSTAILLLHLSFCDLLYILIGFTHYIHVIITSNIGYYQTRSCHITISEKNPFFSIDAPHSENLCYAGAFLRNLAAEADFATMGKCKSCVSAGTMKLHDSDMDMSKETMVLI